MAVDINIYLLGFFFSEIQDDQLIIASPKHMMHKFGFWDHQQNQLQPFPAPPAPLPWFRFLEQGQHDQFPDDILRFSRTDLGMPTNEFFIAPPGDQYQVYFQLPVPADITSVRPGGNMREIGMDKSKVAQSIQKRCGTDIDLSLITRLTYSATGNIGFTDISFFAEHCTTPSVIDIQNLFNDARVVLPRFDLNFLSLIPGPSLPGPGSNENVMTLCEAGAKLSNNPCTECLPKSGQERSRFIPPLLRTANCPQFGVMS
jgi:hypothetical protein